jgi:hypothetical protein
VWPKDAEKASRIPHGDLNVAFSGEARSRVGRFPFEERTPYGVIPGPGLLKFLEAMIDHQAVEIAPLTLPATIPRQRSALVDECPG